MEPSSILSITGLILKTLGLVHKRREGRLEKDEAQELYSRIFCSLLWEVYQNMDRCKGIVIFSQKCDISAGILSFFVRDALFPDFCIMCPEPRVIADLNDIYAAFERIHHWQRVTYDLKSEGANYITGFAKDLFSSKHLDEKYNNLIDILKALNNQVELPQKIISPINSMG